jgi:ESCRT-II complex subunit VPS36
MDRFEYSKAVLNESETFVAKDHSVKLYDGDEKTSYEDGEILLTTHRLFWGRPGEIARGATTLALPLKYITSLDEETASSMIFGKKKRIILNLAAASSNKQPGPSNSSTANFIKLSGRNGVDVAFVSSLNETVAARIWQATETLEEEVVEKPREIKLRTGIMGIERGLQAKQQQRDESISMAFQDLSKLMNMAKDMVGISKAISTKIRDRQGDISEDETVRFKSYLMSLGIDDPVTRDNFVSNTEYYTSLSAQLCEILLDPIEESGGMMALTDVYCRVNRARGLELLSPEDLLNACQMLSGPIQFRQFPSGVLVLQLESHSDAAVAEQTLTQIEEAQTLTVEELSKILSCSVILARERLLTAERAGKICRDESIEGIKFYPNRFLADEES